MKTRTTLFAWRMLVVAFLVMAFNFQRAGATATGILRVVSCTTGANYLEFGVNLVNNSTSGETIYLSAASPIRLTHLAGIVPAGTNTFTFQYVANSCSPSLAPFYATLGTTYNVSYTSSSRLMQVTHSTAVMGNSSASPNCPVVAGDSVSIGRFRLTITNTNFGAGQSVGFAWVTTSGFVGYVNTSATVTNFNSTNANRTLAVSTSCSIPQACSVSLTPSSTGVSCNGGADGTAGVTATGSSPFTYLWGNGATTSSISGLTAGSYTVTVTGTGGCTSSATATVTEPTLLTASASAGTIACQGGSTSVVVSASGGTSPYTGTGTFTVTAGNYSYTITDSKGCTASASASVSDGAALTNNTTNASACGSYTWSVDGNTYTTSGTYSSTSGCNTETLVLTINPVTTHTTSAAACDSYTWSENSVTYTQSGTYSSVTGCHTEILNLTITPSTSNTTNTSACDAYYWSVNGVTYTQSGTYSDVNVCSTEVLVLTIVPTNNNTTYVSACDSYTWSVTGVTYTQNGTYSSVNGCNSDVLVLTINASSTHTTNASACDSYTWAENSVTYTQSGTYSTATGCHTEVLNLTINNSTSNTTTASACTSYTWSVNGVTYTQSGTYSDVNVCATEILSLTITAPPAPTGLACYETATFNGTTCQWDVTGTQPSQPTLACYETATFNGTTCQWDVTGTQPSQPTLACYETATFNGTTCQWDVTGSPNAAITSTASECDTYTWAVNAVTYTQSGTYTYSDAANCQDYILALTITPSIVNTTSASACDSYTWSVNGETYTQSGTYSSGASASFYNNLTAFTTASGNAGYTLSSTETFDSFSSGFYSPLTGTVGSVTWSASAPNGLYVDAAGGSQVLSTNNPEPLTVSFSPGVASVGANIFLTNFSFAIIPGNITLNLSDGSTASYSTTSGTDFGGFTASGALINSITVSSSTSGIVYVSMDNLVVGTGTLAPSCTTDVLVLTVTPSTSDTTFASACDSYTWSVDGQTYTQSGTYSSVSGCDTDVLVLTVTPQPQQPTLACYETATFNNNTCQWDVTGTQPSQPSVACYETATWNGTTCQWDVTGTQPSQPTLACYETATFNNNTCQWDVTGTQPSQPSVACYETATWNGSTCQWDVTGTQPSQPTLACYETATFNNNTCQWDVTGTQPSQPTLACYESATFNGTTCQWDVTGTQPSQPTLACYETATWNGSTCQWDVTGTPLVATATVTGSIACFGGTGSVTVTVTGGTAPYVGDGVQTAAAGNWNYTVADANGCTATSNNVTITEPSKVQGSITVNDATCGQTDGSASVSASGGTSPYSYLWSDGQTTSTASNLASGSYTVTITDANGCTESASCTVAGTGGTPGSAGVIAGAAGVCRNSTYTYSISAVAGATGYDWTLPSGASGSSTSNSITVTFSGTYNGGFICVTPVNSCGSGTQSCLSIPVITLRPSQPGTITFSGPFCGPAVVTCQVPPVANATSYIWAVTGTSATIISGQGTRTIDLNIPAGFTNAQISVYASNCVGNSLTRIQNIIGLPATTQALTGPLYLCPNSTQNYSVAASYGATSYSWSITGNAQILTSVGTNAVVKTNGGWTGGVLTVTATNACGSTPRSYTLYAGPLQPGGITGPANNLCAAAGVTTATYSIAAVTGATSYTWTVPTGMTITSNTGTSITVSISGALTTGSVCVTANNSCGTSAARCLAVSSRPSVPGTVSGPSSVCKSQTGVAYTIAPVTGATGYIWGISGGATISGTGTTGTASFTGSTNTSVTVSVVASNQCGNGTNSRKSVSVNLLCRDNNLSADLSVNAFPNPTNGKVTVSFNANNEDRYIVRLTDLLGKEIYSYEVNAVVGLNVKDIDLGQAAAGVYLLNVRTSSGDSRTLRLVVE